MKVLIIGASGQVGRRLMKLLAGHDCVGTGFRNFGGLQRLDLGDPPAVRQLILSVKPSAIFVPGGVTAVDWCESNAAEAERICIDGSRAVQMTADEIGAHGIHFSTDYVFPGGSGPYRETDRPAPLSAYGRFKLAGEEAVRESRGRWTIIRTSMVYSHDPGGKNFAQFVRDTLAAGGTVKAFSDQTGTPTYAPALARAAIEIMEKDVTGRWHVSGPDVLTRLEFAQKVARAFQLSEDRIQAVTSSELKLAAARPGLKAGLSVEKTRTRLRTPMVSLDDALKEMG